MLSTVKIFQFFWTIVSTIGLLYQLGQISNRYFMYQTRSEVQLSVPDSITVPILSTCWWIKDLMTDMKNKQLNEFYSHISKMTIDEILKNIHPVEKILENDVGCTVRLPNKLAASYPYSTRKECLTMFNITTYIQRDFSCYQFTPTAIDSSTQLSLVEYTLSPQSSGLVYRLYMDQKIFTSIASLIGFVHSPYSSRIHDSIFANSFTRFGKSNMSLGIMVKVSFSGVSIERLEPPFDTACRIFPERASAIQYFLTKLQQETILTLGKVHSFLPIESYGYPMITAAILQIC